MNVKNVIASTLASVVFFAPLSAKELENKLVVITSFPKDLTKSFKKAFEKGQD